MKKIIVIFSTCVLIIIASVFVRQYFISSFFKRHLISETISSPLLFRNDTAGIDLMQLKGKYIVLYLGDSTDKDYEKGLEKYGKMCNSRPLNTDDRVKMFAVRCNPENVSGTVETVSPEANGMPVPILSLENNLLEQLKVNELPTVLMISPEWKIIFRGSSLGAAYKCLVSLTYGV